MQMRASRSSLFYTMPKKTTEKQNLVVAADTKPEDKPVVALMKKACEKRQRVKDLENAVSNLEKESKLKK